MDLLREIGLAAVVWLVLQFLILPTLDTLTKQQSAGRIVGSAIVGLIVAVILARVVLSGLPTVLLFAAALWMAASNSAKLANTLEFRAQTGLMISSGGITMSRVLLVLTIVGGWLALAAQVCDGTTCRGLIP